jgi:predicted O-linked N-acetylglucosamine transferase (SPINDLY family)
MNLQSLWKDALRHHQTGRLSEAERLYQKILQADPRNAVTRHMFGLLRAQQGRHAEAAEQIAAALQANPNSGEVWYNYGNVLTALARLDEALAAFDRALVIGPRIAEVLANRANVLWRLGRPADALAGYDAALSMKPNLLPALLNRADVLRHLKRFDAALEACLRLLTLAPNTAEGWNVRGGVLLETGRFAEALDCLDKAVRLTPDFAAAWSRRGAALLALKRPAEALADFDKALRLEPDNAETLSNKGIALSHLRRFDEAMVHYAKALARDAGLVQAYCNRGHTLRETGHLDQAFASYDMALSLDPRYAKALQGRGLVLADLGRMEEALVCFKSVLAQGVADALGDAANAALSLCDWTKADAFCGEILDAVGAGQPISPLLLLWLDGDPARQQLCARGWMKARLPSAQQSLPLGLPKGLDKIRVGYISADFRMHPVAAAIAGLLERHDRNRFELFGLSLGPDDGSAMHARIARAVDRFADLSMQDDRAAADFIRGLNLDILVDLNGHTDGGRPEILAYRPARVQVSYLGYPGPMGADFIDHVIADPVVLPPEQQAFYDEKIVALPGGFWPAEPARAIAPPPSRREAGLPDDGFVFCCFNNARKINAPLFDVWMRLLAVVPASVLWLKHPGEGAAANLRREASARGIDSARLVFAQDLPFDAHLARHGCADLFLDTLPYNAHATAVDALEAELPVLTCLGTSFAGRVAASLLRGAGMPELVTPDLAAYEALALELARDPLRLGALRAKLAQARSSAPLFDAERFRAEIEAAYVRLHEAAR